MTRQNCVVDVYRLMTLLNELYRSRQKEFLIFMPYQREPVFSVHLMLENEAASEVKLLVRYAAYAKLSDGVRSPWPAHDLPDYGTLQALMLQAGIVEYPNFSDFLKCLHQMCQRDFHRGDRPVFMGLDTNLFRDRFYSAHFPVLQRIPHNKIGFSVSPNVKDELAFDRRKYRTRDLKDLVQLCVDNQFRDAVDGFFNQPCLHDRLCRLGFVELDKAKRIHWIELLPELDPRDHEKSPDSNIIKTYKLAAAERNVDILLLSRDDGFIGHALGIPGLKTFQVQNPVFKGNKFPARRWRQVCQLVYLCAVVFGVARLQALKDAYLIQGIWKGKKSTDWNHERVQITSLLNNSRVFENCQKAWRVLDAGSWRVFA